MENKKFDIEEIKRKSAIIDNTIITLKKEFVGIDKQIDEIMNNVKTWYLYPQLQTKPLVVCLWGLSGIGKTSLVKRISQLLNIEEDFVYFNFASIAESSSWEIEQQIEDELQNEKSNRLFVYDEFQYANTLNPINGEESEKKSGLKPFWELLDSGIIHKRNDFWNTRGLFRVIDYMTKIGIRCDMKIENGIWVNAAECLKDFPHYDLTKFSEVFNWENNINAQKSNDNIEETTSGSCSASSPHDEIDDSLFFIKRTYVDLIIRAYGRNSDRIVDEIELFHRMEQMDYDEIIEFIIGIYNDSKKGYNLCFNDSIIFVIGNLDEAYECSFSVNPDMSPDQFKKITENISIVDIKESLKKRFRNEQIARFGNIHIIYPSFSSENFKELINLSLEQYATDVLNMCGYNLRFDDKIKQIIYDEGVYPTHGTRPIFSTVQEIVKSPFPNIIMSMYNDGIINEVKYICYSFDGDNVSIRVLDGHEKQLKTYSFNVKLRLKNLRKSNPNDDFQALCALHESGHFVMYAKLFGKMPEKLVSKTADSDAGGFLMEDIDSVKNKLSKDDMISEISVLLGGYVAEKMFFGDNQFTCGARSDLLKATKTASEMVRNYGMGGIPYITTYLEGSSTDPFGGIINEDNQDYINVKIKKIIQDAVRNVESTFENVEWKKMLKESAQYLCENSFMPKEKMQELYDKVSDNVKLSQRDENYYRNIINNM